MMRQRWIISSVVGLLWALIQPLLTLAIFVGVMWLVLTLAPHDGVKVWISFHSICPNPITCPTGAVPAGLGTWLLLKARERRVPSWALRVAGTTGGMVIGALVSIGFPL